MEAWGQQVVGSYGAGAEFSQALTTVGVSVERTLHVWNSPPLKPLRVRLSGGASGVRG